MQRLADLFLAASCLPAQAPASSWYSGDGIRAIDYLYNGRPELPQVVVDADLQPLGAIRARLENVLVAQDDRYAAVGGARGATSVADSARRPEVPPLEAWVPQQDLETTFEWTKRFYGSLGAADSRATNF